MEVQGRPEEVSLRRVHPLDLVPPLVHAHQGLLRLLVGVRRAPGHEVQGLGQADVLRVEELLEARPVTSVTSAIVPEGSTAAGSITPEGSIVGS